MLEVGNIFEGKYNIIKALGEGNFGKVFLCVNIYTGKKWALKEIHKDNSCSDNNELVRRELNALKKLNHKNLLSISDIFETEDSYLLMTDYIEGMNLCQLLSEYKKKGFSYIPPPLVYEIALSLCKVIDYIQSENVIHGDVKPSNIMVTSDMDIILIDFGGASVIGERIRTCIGTAGYSPPEMYEGITDKTTDIYSVGALMHYLLTGVSPDKNHCKQKPVTALNPALLLDKKETGLIISLENIISVCTDERNKRYKDGKTLLDALHGIKKELPLIHKRKVLKTVSFLVILFLIPVFGSISVYGGYMKNLMREKIYDDCIAEASRYYGSNAADYYRLAIMLSPEEKTAYLKLLEALTLDNHISNEDDEILMSALNAVEYNRAVSNEDNLRADEAAYTEVAYRLGMAYYYCFDDLKKVTAYKYLKVVADADDKVLPSDKLKWKEICKNLVNMISYKEKIGIPGKAGDTEVTYKNYYEDMLFVISKEFDEGEEKAVRLWLIKDFVNAVYLYCDDFLNSGISLEKMKSDLESIRSEIEAYDNCDELQIIRLNDEIKAYLLYADERINAEEEERYKKEVAI